MSKRGFEGWTEEAVIEHKKKSIVQADLIVSKSLEIVKSLGKPKPSKRQKQPINDIPKETANQITKNVIRAINFQPKCVAYRINNVGIYDEKLGLHRKANTQKGIFDISSIIRGRAAWFEVKAGKDKPSRDQLIFQQEVRLAGGIAEFVPSTDEFLKMFTEILSQ